MRASKAIFFAVCIGAVSAGGGAALAEQTNSHEIIVTAAYRTVSPSITLHYISPIVYFRGILGMTPAQRQRALAGKTPEERKAILEKVQEYEAMPRDIREERLRQTELHWRFMTLLRLDPAQREPLAREISPLDQPMVIERLRQWDELPAATRKELLENEKFIRSYVDWQVGSPIDREEIVRKIPAQRQAYYIQELKRWQAIPVERRTELCAQFRRFFVMSGEEQTNTIRTLSEAERQQMEQALQAYKELPAAQRQHCIDSFGKFAAMDPAERAQFLRNAAKWESMSPHERELWRTLVEELPLTPPVPPGMPPMPPGLLWPVGAAPDVPAR